MAVNTLSALAAALDPVLLMQSAGHEADCWQADLLRSDDKRSLVLCSRQAGKSTVAAAMAVHEASFKPGSLTLLLSPSLRQSGELFRKVLAVYKASGAAVAVKSETALRLELANHSRVIALPAGEETIRGFSGVTLLIIDEASRVEDELYYSVRPMLAVSGGRLVALTTPFGRKGWFYNEWANSSYWTKIRITANDCPRLSDEILEQERESLGEAWFRQEYLCEFIDAAGEGFIWADWLEQCANPNREPDIRERVDIGLDVARSTKGDNTVFVVVQGQVVLDIEKACQPDLMATVGRAVQLIEKHRARSIRIDDTGVGGGVTDRLKEVQSDHSRYTPLGECESVAFIFGRKAFQPERFADVRSEMWWILSERLRQGKLQIPRNLALFEQLAAPQMLEDSTGRLRLESKDSMRRRSLRSPDLADALALAVYPHDWVPRPRMATAF